MTAALKQVAFVFPGQGAQTVGMGKDFYDRSPRAKEVYDIFDALTQNTVGNTLSISEICFNGPEEILKKTLYTQPCILATSLAAYALFLERCSNLMPAVTAGHSLGEYGALYASGVFDLPTAARLVKKRAELMEAAPEGAMSAVLGLEQGKLEDVIARIKEQHANGVISVANFNTPDQIVISGSPSLLELAAPLLKEAGAKRVLPLPVGGAFHSSLMQPAAEDFKAFLADFEFHDALTPVITNVDASITKDGGEFREKLGEQIDHSVRWTQTMAVMQQHAIDTVIEFGPGKVLTGMIKKVAPEISVYNVFDLDSLDQTVGAVEAALAVST